MQHDKILRVRVSSDTLAALKAKFGERKMSDAVRPLIESLVSERRAIHFANDSMTPEEERSALEAYHKKRAESPVTKRESVTGMNPVMAKFLKDHAK